MDIYLVRVSQRADRSLYLERKPNATTDDDYIAISHVWGTPDTITDKVVDGHPGVVKLSPVKRDILSILSHPDICGFGWFWMDLFCIDQTESATISNNWDNSARSTESFTLKEMEHIDLCGLYMVCLDPWFERLWTRQEGLYGKVVLLNLIACPREGNQVDRDYKH